MICSQTYSPLPAVRTVERDSAMLPVLLSYFTSSYMLPVTENIYCNPSNCFASLIEQHYNGDEHELDTGTSASDP